jgi:hypothetical protein
LITLIVDARQPSLGRNGKRLFGTTIRKT